MAGARVGLRAHPEGVYNTAVVFSPDGELIATYRKCFPWLPFETSLPGDAAVVFDIPDVGRIGLADLPRRCRSRSSSGSWPGWAPRRSSSLC